MSRSTIDTERFYRLLWPHRGTVLRSARLLVRDPATADDLAQETMLKAFRSIQTFADQTNPRAWLLSILRNTRIDHLRAQARHRNDVSFDETTHTVIAAVAEHDEDTFAPTDTESLLDRLGDADLISALQRLPEEIRWTLLLVEVEGMDHASAAEVLSVPVGTVKSRASRGRVMLRAALEPIARERGWVRPPESSNQDSGKAKQVEPRGGP